MAQSQRSRGGSQLATTRSRRQLSGVWQAGQLRNGRWNVPRLLACLCAGAGLVAGCADTGGYSTSPPAIRCNETGSTAERHACQ
jgi:hypothetical protein